MAITRPFEQATMPWYVAPVYKAPGTFSAPRYNEGKIASLTQTQSAGAVRGLRSAMQRLSGQRSDNPNAKRMLLRDAMAGYGQGLQNAISRASESARGLYNTEYAALADVAKTNYITDAQAKQAKYQADIQSAVARYNAEATKNLTEYQTAWSNYNKEKERQIANEELVLKRQAEESLNQRAAKELSFKQQESEASAGRFQQELAWKQQESEAQRAQAAEELKLKKWLAEQEAMAKSNPMGYGITRPRFGADAYENARWYAAHPGAYMPHKVMNPFSGVTKSGA